MDIVGYVLVVLICLYILGLFIYRASDIANGVVLVIAVIGAFYIIAYLSYIAIDYVDERTFYFPTEPPSEPPSAVDAINEVDTALLTIEQKQ